MKSKLLYFFVFIASATFVSCSEDDEKKLKGDPDLTHTGDKWIITSIDYTLIDQNTSGSGAGQTFKSGSNGTGAFYFVDGEAKGSFEMTMEGYNKEDVFNYTIDGESVSIVTIEQSVGATTNQNVVALSGSSSETEMSLSGTIVKQSTTGQFLLEFEAVLEKE
jgi:hypothetical protein